MQLNDFVIFRMFLFSYNNYKFMKISTGRIYAKGKADNSACIKDNFAQEKTKKPHMSLKFGTCGMRSLRSVSFPE